MYEQEEKDESEILRSRIKTLKHVAIEISDEIRLQNKKINELQPSFSETIMSALSNVKLIKRVSPKTFRKWLNYIGGTLIIGFVFFMLFIVF